MADKSDLPFSSQFTPAQIRLPDLLSLVVQHEGDQEALLEAIIGAFFAHHGGDLKELAKNTILALISYGVLDRERRVTPFGRELIAVRDSGQVLYDTLARHILMNLRGLDVLGTLQDMRRGQMKMDLTTIRESLEEHGVHMPRGGTHFSGVKNWLQKAGVIDDDYNIDDDKVQQLIGSRMNDASQLAEVSPEQRAFLKALVNLAPSEPIPSNQVAQYASHLYGVRFPDKSLPKLLQPLVDDGFITMEKTTEGRGAKPHLVSLTAKTQSKMVLPLLEALEHSTGLALRLVYNRPLAEILADVDIEDTYTKGRGLEELSIYLLRLLDLKFRFWRLRSQRTGGAEVDVLVEGDRLIFSRWQIQCKNTKTVSLEDIAKEVGLAVHLKSNVVMIVSTGTFAKDARTFANSVMGTTNLQVILLDRKDLQTLMKEPSSIGAILDREAENAMEIKRIEAD